MLRTTRLPRRRVQWPIYSDKSSKNIATGSNSTLVDSYDRLSTNRKEQAPANGSTATNTTRGSTNKLIYILHYSVPQFSLSSTTKSKEGGQQTMPPIRPHTYNGLIHIPHTFYYYFQEAPSFRGWTKSTSIHLHLHKNQQRQKLIVL